MWTQNRWLPYRLCYRYYFADDDGARAGPVDDAAAAAPREIVERAAPRLLSRHRGVDHEGGGRSGRPSAREQSIGERRDAAEAHEDDERHAARLHVLNRRSKRFLVVAAHDEKRRRQTAMCDGDPCECR